MASDTSLVFNILAKDKASKTWDKMKAGAAVAGAAIGAALAAGVAGMMEKGKADALLAAQLGAGPEMAAEFGKMSGNLYAQGFGENVGDIDNALKGVWQNGLVDEDAATADIEAVTSRVLTLGQIMVEDSDRVSTAVSQMLRTGIAKSSEEAFDLLARGTQQGVNKAGDLLDTFNEYPTQFRKLGLDGPAAMGLLSQAIKAGARDSDVAADALKEFSIRAVDGSKLSAEGYKMLGLNAEKMTAQIAAGGPKASAGLDLVLDKLRGIKDPVKQAAAATALFGTQAEDLGQALFAMDTSTASQQLGNIEGAAKKAGDTLAQDAGAKLDTFKRKAEMALVTQLAKAVPYIESTFGFLAKHQGVVVPIAVALGTFATVIGVIVAATKVWTAVQAAWNVVMMINPVVLIVLAIIALIAIIVLIATKTTWFQQLWHAVWGGITAAFQAWWGLFSGFWTTIGQFFANLFSGWWNLFTGTWSRIYGWVTAAGRLWWAGFSGFWTGVGRFFSGLVSGWWNLFTGFWSRVFQAIASGYSWVTGKLSAIVGYVKGLPARIASAASGMFNGIRNAFRSAINWIIGHWNGLSFTIGGGSFMGMNIPSASFGTPNIPYLATGGDVMRQGLAFIHANERILPAAQVKPLQRGGGNAGGVARVLIDLFGTDEELKRRIRKMVQVEGGNVQIVFGGRS